MFKKTLFIISGIYFFCSCISNSNIDLLDKSFSDKKNWVHFIFLSDSTFRYTYNNIDPEKSSGLWYRKGNSIVLNSYNQTTDIQLIFTKLKNNTDDIKINVQIKSDKGNEKDYICIPYSIKSDKELFYPSKGGYLLTLNNLIDSLYFQVYRRPQVITTYGIYNQLKGLKTEIIDVNLKTGETANISICIVDSLFSYRVFNNEKLEIKSENSMIFKNQKKKIILKN